MNIWLITIGEPLPTDKGNPRLHRVGILANTLAERNHKIVWWTSSFDHVLKTHRTKGIELVEITEKYHIQFLRGCGYKRHISLSRIIDHTQVAQQFKELSQKSDKPDIILASFPSIELAKQATVYAQKNNIPIFIDYRDLWPEIFELVAPPLVRPIVKFFLKPLNNRVKSIFSKSTGLISMTQPFLQLALDKVGRPQHSKDRVFHFGYPNTQFKETDLIDAFKIWENCGVIKDSIFRVCLFSQLSKVHDYSTIIQAAKILTSKGLNTQFILCGQGDGLDQYKNEAKNASNIIFPGFISNIEIISLMKISDVGIIPYTPSLDFNSSIPNKAIEYMYGSLPILTSITGHLADIIKGNNCGKVYQYKNPESLANVIEYLINNPEEKQEMSKNAVNLYKSSFESKKLFEEFADFLEQEAQIREPLVINANNGLNFADY
jgi:glycosyltransferase involved in cell wall biosynthesis